MFKKIVLSLIFFYQRFISPLKVPTCRFYPSCSHYTMQAVDKYGVFRGLFKGLLRICRCHPLHPGGYDPID